MKVVQACPFSKVRPEGTGLGEGHAGPAAPVSPKNKDRQEEWLLFMVLLPGLQHLGLKYFTGSFYEMTTFITPV